MMEKRGIDFLHKFNVEITSILETKIRRRNQRKTDEFFDQTWGCISNVAKCDTKRGDSIWILWNPQIWIANTL